MKILILISHPAHNRDLADCRQDMTDLLEDRKSRSYPSLKISQLRFSLIHSRLTATVDEDDLGPVIDDFTFHTSTSLFGTTKIQPVTVNCCVLPD